MKKLITVLVLVVISCNEVKISKEEKSSESTLKIEKTIIDTIKKSEINNTLEISYKSTIRPNQELILEKVYIDTVQFINFNDNYDYMLFFAQKKKEKVSLIYDLIYENKFDFFQGDEIEVKWKIDSISIAGDDERLDFSEWLISAKKIKDGKVSLFRKKFTKPIKYINHHEYSDTYTDHLYKLVEYYLANSQQEIVKNHVKDPNTKFIFSIGKTEREGIDFTVLGISNDFESHLSTIQWLYYDSDKDILYEYDLANDKLIEFK